MFRTLSFAHALTHMQPTPHTAMHSWRLGVTVFLPAKDACIFLSPPSALQHHCCPHSQCKCHRAGTKLQVLSEPARNKGLWSEARAGLIPPSLLASVKAKGQSVCFFFSFRSEEAVSESSSLSSCIPSISHTASWTRIGRQISTVISQQQRGCYIVWSRVILGPLWLPCGLWVWGCPHRCRLSPGFAPCWLAELLNRLLDLFFLFMSPQAYMQSLALCNAFQSIKAGRGAILPMLPICFTTVAIVKILPSCISSSTPTVSFPMHYSENH